MPDLETWSGQGRRMKVRGHELFLVDTRVVEAGAENENDRTPLLLLHGFPTSSLDFHRVLPHLAAGRRVIVHDHLGFGLSDKPPRYSYSLLEQAEVALQLWQALDVGSAHLLAHDYGTSVATEILARRERGGIPVELRSVTLSNGSLLLDLARLRLSQRLLRSPWTGPVFQRLANRPYFKHVMRRLWGDRSKADDADLDAMWDGIRHADGHLRASRISSYLDERVRFRDRWIGALRRLDVPLHLLWGRRDPVAVPAIAERLAAEVPGARLSWLEELGHYPMLEDPGAYAAGVLDFLD